ncbi:amino acid ABC transporter permease [Anaeromicropila populeti]|uniref:Polar amino acid transport system permease protein n=1 Tax=Anaeromicropila populeti TaxID=37658 RepID=A0A1I6HT19_9FIRM|nr:amino acid ABC transporter permease [Anaeromicropila populeti]SFR57574.1 polar amino acid transport system permease protein [Anaeromicropila populeti]
MNYEFDWQAILSGQYLEWILQGLQCSISLMILSSLIAVAIGVFVTFGNLSTNPLIHFISSVYIELCRNIPTLIWLLFFYYVFPELFPEKIEIALNSSTMLNYWAAIAGLSISSSGYISEIIRGGIMAVPREQIAAAYSLGHSKAHIWKYIIWPQAIRNCFPPLVTRIIHNVKNTSLALSLSVHEIMWATQQIESITFRGLEVTILATIFYLTINFVLSHLASLAEKHVLATKN